MGRKMAKDVTLLFLLALLVRVGYALFFVEPEYLLIEDQTLYIQLAQQFPDSGFLGVDPERVPGYPLFIASIHTIFGEGLWNVISIQILLDSIIIFKLITDNIPAIQNPLPKSDLAIRAITTQLALSNRICIEIIFHNDSPNTV